MKKDGKISCNNEKEKLTPANVKKKKKTTNQYKKLHNRKIEENITH